MLGGQWTGLAGRSGVWGGMHTNTSQIMTALSDLEHESEVVFPSSPVILDYLHRFAEGFDLTSRIRFDAGGNRQRNGGAWSVQHAGASESFDRVVVATGRFHGPAFRSSPGWTPSPATPE